MKKIITILALLTTTSANAQVAPALEREALAIAGELQSSYESCEEAVNYNLSSQVDKRCQRAYDNYTTLHRYMLANLRELRKQRKKIDMTIPDIVGGTLLDIQDIQFRVLNSIPPRTHVRYFYRAGYCDVARGMNKIASTKEWEYWVDICKLVDSGEIYIGL